MHEKGEAKHALNRTFSVEANESVIKGLPVASSGRDLTGNGPFFWKDRIFVGNYNCYSTGDRGPTVHVYNRDDYKLLRELETIECDHAQQDYIYSFQVQKGKLFVRTGFRLDENERPNLFVFDLENFAKIAERHEQGTNRESEFFGLDTSLATTDQARQLDKFVKSGRKIERLLGRYETNNDKYLVTSGDEKERKFHIYNLESLERYENIDLTRPKARYHLFNDLDKIIVTYFTSVQTFIEIYDIVGGQRRTILSLGNDAGRLGVKGPVIETYKHYLIAAHRDDLIFYDAKKMKIAKVIRQVVPRSKEGESGSRIDSLVVDREKKRLLIFTLHGHFNGLNRLLDIAFLK